MCNTSNAEYVAGGMELCRQVKELYQVKVKRGSDSHSRSVLCMRLFFATLTSRWLVTERKRLRNKNWDTNWLLKL